MKNSNFKILVIKELAVKLYTVFLWPKFNLLTVWHGNAIPTFPIKYLFDQTHYMLTFAFFLKRHRE